MIKALSTSMLGGHMRVVCHVAFIVLSACFSASAPPTIHPELPLLSYCDLVTNPVAHDGELLRVRATYLSSFEQSEFSADGCDHRAWVEFTADYKKNTPKRVREMFESLSSPVELVAVGKFTGVKPTRVMFGRTTSTGFGHLNASDFKFEVLAVESVRPTHFPR